MIEAHANPAAMARCLISYIPSDEKVQREVRAVFGSSPCLYSIRRMRDARENQHAQDLGEVERGWDWRGDKLRERMATASDSFLMAIERERTREWQL